jgi:hypothetical protein
MINVIPPVKRGLGLVLGGACCASVLFATSALAAPQAKSSAAKKWLSVNTSTRTATYTWINGYNGKNNGYNIDGYFNGQMVLTVPVGWTVKVKCSVASSSPVNHSCAVTKKLSATKTAFAHAAIKDPTGGLVPGGSETFKFVPTTTGTYKMLCLVPGHEEAGHWDTLKVIASGTPSITTK